MRDEEAEIVEKESDLTKRLREYVQVLGRSMYYFFSVRSNLIVFLHTNATGPQSRVAQDLPYF